MIPDMQRNFIMATLVPSSQLVLLCGNSNDLIKGGINNKGWSSRESRES